MITFLLPSTKCSETGNSYFSENILVRKVFRSHSLDTRSFQTCSWGIRDSRISQWTELGNIFLTSCVHTEISLSYLTFQSFYLLFIPYLYLFSLTLKILCPANLNILFLLYPAAITKFVLKQLYQYY